MKSQFNIKKPNWNQTVQEACKLRETERALRAEQKKTKTLERKGRLKDYRRERSRTLIKRLKSKLRNQAVQGLSAKDETYLEYIGCTAAEFRKHLAGQFKPGMSFENHGYWHLDHIKPLASFNLEDPIELEKAGHFKNIQPLWALDNLRKSDTAPNNASISSEIKRGA